MIQVPKNELIEFTNLVNECCTVMEHDEVDTWLTTPKSNFNMDKPIDFFLGGWPRKNLQNLIFY